MIRAGRILTLLLFVGGCAGFPYGTIEPPRVFLSDIRLDNVKLLEQRYRLELRVQNPNDVELPIGGMKYRLSLNGEEFATGVNNRSWTLPAHAEQVITVHLVSDLARVLEQFRRLEKRGGTVDYALSGGVMLGRRGPQYPFRTEGQLRLTD